MTIGIYVMDGSPPCKAVLMTAKYLDIPLKHTVIDYEAKEHLKPEFLKINPAHTTPTIDDKGFILWESRAIITYLVNKYAPNSNLYPKDPKERAEVDRMLNFDIGTLYKAALANFIPLWYGKPLDPELDEAYKKTLSVYEEILQKTPYAAGQHLTLADISIYAGLTFSGVIKYSYDSYPKISAWLQKVKEENLD